MTSLKRKSFVEDQHEDLGEDRRKLKKHKANHKNKGTSLSGLVSHWSKDFIGKVLGKTTENKGKEKRKCHFNRDEIKKMDSTKKNRLFRSQENEGFVKSVGSDRIKVEYLSSVYTNDKDDKSNNFEETSFDKVSLSKLKSMALQCQYSDGDGSYKKLKNCLSDTESDDAKSHVENSKKKRTCETKPVKCTNRKTKARTQSLTDCRSSISRKDRYSDEKPSKKSTFHRYNSQTLLSNNYKSDNSSLDSSTDSVFSTSINENEKYTFFWRKYSPFSQHHACSFVVRGTKYNCAEQFMMEQKAEMFGDKVMAAKIMATADPALQKKYGRMVANFNNAVWQTKCKDIVKKANIAKFSQNKHLLSALNATEGTILVEASPVDRLWGIGLAADDPRAQNKSTWRGKNWLGYCLTDVREILRKKDSA